jgi:hypothetical protein
MSLELQVKIPISVEFLPALTQQTLNTRKSFFRNYDKFPLNSIEKIVILPIEK